MRHLLCGNRKRHHHHQLLLRLVVQAVVVCALLLITWLDICWPPFFEYEYEDDAASSLLLLLLAPNNAENGGGNHLLRKAFLDGVEKLEYMYNAQVGKAKMAELVGRRAIVETVKQCAVGIEPKRNASGGRQWTKNGHLFVYSAHLDHRRNSMFSGIPHVQVLASSFGTFPMHHNNNTYYCHFRHYIKQRRNDEHTKWSWQGTVVKARIWWIWQRAWDPRTEFYNPFLITCPMDTTNLAENADSSFVLVSHNPFCVRSEQSLDSANFTKIIKPDQRLMINDQTVFGLRADQIKIAVCTKGLSFMEESIAFSARKMVEWVLLQRALGANDITLYLYWIPPNVRRALQRMATKKQLEIVELELPGNSPNDAFLRHQFLQRNRQQKRRHELIPYNDCFNRYSSTHHFVLVVDIDELVVPMRHQNWQQLLHELLAQGKWRAEPSSISVRNVFKFWHSVAATNASSSSTKNAAAIHAKNGSAANVGEEEDSLFNNARYRRSRTAQLSGQYGKSFVNTRSVATVFNHFGLHRLYANVSNTLHVRAEDALKLHWRAHCPEAEFGTEKCRELVNQAFTDEEDTLLDRFKGQIEMEANKIMEHF